MKTLICLTIVSAILLAGMPLQASIPSQPQTAPAKGKTVKVAKHHKHHKKHHAKA